MRQPRVAALLLSLVVLPPLAAQEAGNPDPEPPLVKGWRASAEAWKVWKAPPGAKVLRYTGAGSGGIRTEKSYGDFELSFDLKAPKARNTQESTLVAFG